MSHSHHHKAPKGKVNLSPAVWLNKFEKAFTFKVEHAELPFSPEERLELIKKIRDFAAVDCFEPKLLKGGNIGISDALAPVNEILISLRESIRNLNLGREVEETVTRLTEESCELPLNQMSHQETGLAPQIQ
jgi:hypothetical protein